MVPVGLAIVSEAHAATGFTMGSLVSVHVWLHMP